MKKFIELMNDDRVGYAVLFGMLITFVIAINVFSITRDYDGVRQVAPVELTECSTCSP